MYMKDDEYIDDDDFCRHAIWRSGTTRSEQQSPEAQAIGTEQWQWQWQYRVGTQATTIGTGQTSVQPRGASFFRENKRRRYRNKRVRKRNQARRTICLRMLR